MSLVQPDWRIPAIRLADALHVRICRRSPRFKGLLGACHALEVPFVFDIPGNGTEPLAGADPPQQLADAVHAAWIAFAMTGDCGWPKYDLNRRGTMRFDTMPEVADDPRSAERALWEGVRYSMGPLRRSLHPAELRFEVLDRDIRREAVSDMAIP